MDNTNAALMSHYIHITIPAILKCNESCFATKITLVASTYVDISLKIFLLGIDSLAEQ